jgi:hypothetical protein
MLYEFRDPNRKGQYLMRNLNVKGTHLTDVLDGSVTYIDKKVIYSVCIIITIITISTITTITFLYSCINSSHLQ